MSALIRQKILKEIHSQVQRRGKTTANEIAFNCNATVREVFWVARSAGFIVENNKADAMHSSTIFPALTTAGV